MTWEGPGPYSRESVAACVEAALVAGSKRLNAFEDSVAAARRVVNALFLAGLIGLERAAPPVELFIRCPSCNGLGEVETTLGFDQCPDCSSTLFVPLSRCLLHPMRNEAAHNPFDSRSWGDGASDRQP